MARGQSQSGKMAKGRRVCRPGSTRGVLALALLKRNARSDRVRLPIPYEMTADIDPPREFYSWNPVRQRAWSRRCRDPNKYLTSYPLSSDPLPPAIEAVEEEKGCGARTRSTPPRGCRWTEEEHTYFMLLLKQYLPIGGKWGLFSALVPGRSAVECRSYYQCIVRAGFVEANTGAVSAELITKAAGGRNAVFLSKNVRAYAPLIMPSIAAARKELWESFSETKIRKSWRKPSSSRGTVNSLLLEKGQIPAALPDATLALDESTSRCIASTPFVSTNSSCHSENEPQASSPPHQAKPMGTAAAEPLHERTQLGDDGGVEKEATNLAYAHIPETGKQDTGVASFDVGDQAIDRTSDKMETQCVNLGRRRVGAVAPGEFDGSFADDESVSTKKSTETHKPEPWGTNQTRGSAPSQLAPSPAEVEGLNPDNAGDSPIDEADKPRFVETGAPPRELDGAALVVAPSLSTQGHIPVSARKPPLCRNRPTMARKRRHVDSSLDTSSQETAKRVARPVVEAPYEQELRKYRTELVGWCYLCSSEGKALGHEAQRKRILELLDNEQTRLSASVFAAGKKHEPPRTSGLLVASAALRERNCTGHLDEPARLRSISRESYDVLETVRQIQADVDARQHQELMTMRLLSSYV